jgi:PEP-CTERM motif
MKVRHPSMFYAVGLLAFGASVHEAAATTQVVSFNRLIESATVAPALQSGDALVLDTLVTQETGALMQSITFTLATAFSLQGEAAWEVSTSGGSGPRLVGVNIDVLDSSNSVVLSDTFAGVLAGFAHSTFTGDIAPGTYTLVATGTGERASSLDVSMTVQAPAPEPATYGLLLSGIGLLAFAGWRLKRQDTYN